MPRAGKYRDRVIVLKKDDGTTPDSHGHGPVYPLGWVPISTVPDGAVWAEVQSLTGGEFWQAQQMVPRCTHRVRTRYVEGINERSKLYLRKDGRILNVAEIPRRVSGDRKVELEFMAVETPREEASV